VFAGEQAAHLELLQRGRCLGDCFNQLGLLTGIVDLAGHLVQQLSIGDVAGEAIERIDVTLHIRILTIDLLGQLLVVPQIGARHLKLKFAQAGTLVTDLEVGLCLAEAASQVLDVVGEIAHEWWVCDA
jgi:hypothetical protein